MAAFKSNLVLVMAVMLAAMHFHGTVAQTTHVVGNALGWTIPPTGASAYTTWASRQTFRVGDILLFNFTTGQHNVAEVAQAAYGPCTITNPISVTATGPASVTLNAPGTHYYVCTVGTHCQIGQKLTVNVSPASGTRGPSPAPSATTNPPPSSSPSPASPISPPISTESPSGSTVPPPTGSTTLPPPSPNGVAPSITAMVPATFLAVALAFFY